MKTIVLAILFAVVALSGGDAWAHETDHHAVTAEILAELRALRAELRMALDQINDTTFSDLAEGQSIVLAPAEGSLVCVRFTGPWRFESYDHDRSSWYGGDYADVTASDGSGATGTLSLT